MALNRANSKLISKAISEFPWENRLNSLYSPNEQVSLLNKTILNIMSNFVPNDKKTIRPSDPPWFSNDVRRRLNKHNKIYNKFKKNLILIFKTISFEFVVNFVMFI